MYSYRIEQAIRAATILHRDQIRKGSIPLPFISHLYSVAFSLTDYTDDENVIVAALLHDTLEDTDYTEEELQEDFGGEITEIVLALTEPKTKDGHKLDWIARKQAYAKQLKHGPMAAVMVAAADKMHNFRAIVEEYSSDHVRFLQDFGKNIPARKNVYQEITDVILDRLPDGSLKNDYRYVYDEYLTFLTTMETTI